MFRDKSNQPTFPGIIEPSIPFDDVRDGRRSTLFYYDVDLTNARSINAGTPLILNLAGNSFYVDQDTNTVGYATVHFQDTNLGISPAPIYVGPGFIANVPFTQLLIENTAQAGKRLRIFYGVDIDFQAGVNAQIAVTGTLNVIEQGMAYSASWVSNTNLAANTPATVFTPAANTNGALIEYLGAASSFNATDGTNAFIAHTAAPGNLITGDCLAVGQKSGLSTYYMSSISLQGKIIIPAGKGLYFITSAAETNITQKSVLYKLL